MRAAAIGLVYLAIAALGVGGLSTSSTQELLGGRGLLVVLLLVVGLAGLARAVHGWWFARHRPGAVLGTSPSGLPAVVLRRSRFRTVTSVAVTGALCAASAITAAGLVGDRPGWAALCALVAVVLLWPLVPVVAGRVHVGGLYLTAQGIEHVRDAVSWTMRWDQVAGASPREPLGLVLEAGQQPERTRRVRWVWDREVSAPDGTVGVECRSLAIDAVLVAAAVNTAVGFPQRRAELGTPAAMQWDVFRGA